MNIQMYNQPLADNIAKAIKELGVKQCTVAKKAGFSEQTFSDMLKGRRIIKACDIPRIAVALGLTPNDLYNLPQKPDKKPA